MFEPLPRELSWGQWSDQHGVIERHQALAASGSFFDPGDIAAHGPLEEHGPEVSAVGRGRTPVQRGGSTEQARSLRRQAVAYVASGGWQVAQAEANHQATACGSEGARLRWVLQSRGGLCPGLEGRPASRAADHRPWRVRSTGLPAGRSVPVRLVGRLGGDCRRANEAAGRALQALLQPRVHRPGLSAADPRDAVRRP